MDDELGPGTVCPKPKRKRSNRGRGGKKHGRGKTKRWASQHGLAYPLKGLPEPIPGDAAVPEPIIEPEQPAAAEGPETPPVASQPPEPEKPAIPQSLVDGIIESEADVRMIRRLMLDKSWEIPDGAKKFLPADLMAIFLGKLRKGNEVVDSLEITPEVRIAAARLITMMHQSNIAAAAQFLPSRGAVRAKVNVRSAASIQAGGVSQSMMGTSVDVSIYIPDNGRDEDGRVRLDESEIVEGLVIE